MKVRFRESSNHPISLISPRIRMNLCDPFPHSETCSSCDRTSLLTLRIGDGSRTRQSSKIKVKVQQTSRAEELSTKAQVLCRGKLKIKLRRGRSPLHLRSRACHPPVSRSRLPASALVLANDETNTFKQLRKYHNSPNTFANH